MKKQWLSKLKNKTRNKSYGSNTAVNANELMFNGSVKFYWLKRKLKYFKHWKNYEYLEKYEQGTETVFVFYDDPNSEKGFLFVVVHDPYTEYIGIHLKVYTECFFKSDEHARAFRSFDMYQNLYVTQHFKEFVCVWTRLALEYENFEVYENIIDEYTFYREIIENYVQIIEMGCRFRKQCWMHELPMEIRKKIYYWIPKIFPKQLLKCREYSKRLFPF